MTRFQALCVMYLRKTLECSWRVIEAMYNNRYYSKIPFNLGSQACTNQENGRLLCTMAEDLLGVDFDEEYDD